jgi:hypothetical protein
MLNLNESSAGVLNLVFKIALTTPCCCWKDLRAMLCSVGDNAKEFTTAYGNVSAASVGAIPRACCNESQGADKFLASRCWMINDFMTGWQCVNNILTAQADELPRLYATFLLWMLSEPSNRPRLATTRKPKAAFL